MRRSIAMTMFFGWFVLVPMLGFSQTPVILLNSQQILEASQHGVEIPATGEYTLWAWSLDNTPLTVAIDGQPLEYTPNPKAAVDVYSWKSLGRVTVNEPKILAVRPITDTKTQTLNPNCVGWLALSSQDQWSPQEWFALSKLFPSSVQASDDQRLGIIRSKDHFYRFPQYSSKREWLDRKQYLKDHFLISMGCYPRPPKTKLNPHITGRIDYDDYSIENVYFESMPGFFVTGNLYKPKGKRGPFPAILCPHGHWTDGILTDIEENSIPGRCINFARQGYVVFAIDMIGYNNSKQLTHQFGGPSEWLWGLSLHGLQYWNSVRAIDYLVSLKEVDQNRISCTGASGGGTQTYGLMAVDERIKVAAPVNMLSSHFQGGCLCENCPNLRIDLNNVEFGAMMAPRPLMMVSCTGDWTAETLRVEYPAIRSIYELMDSPERLGVIQIDAGHNYNRLSREAVYAWFGRWVLGNDRAEEFKELPFTFDPEKMHVFPDKLPDNAIDEPTLIAQWKEMSEEQLQPIFPDKTRSLNALRRRSETLFPHVLGVNVPAVNDLVIERVKAEKKGDLFVEKILLGRKGVGDRIPAILLVPPKYSTQGTLLVHGEGKEAWFDPQTGQAGELLQSLLDMGQTVLLADVFMTGEYNTPFTRAERNRDIPHFLTYNQSDTALRVQDIVTAFTYLNSRSEAKQVNLMGGGDAGLWCLLVSPFAQNLQSVTIDAAGFDNRKDEDFMERLYIPGLRRAGDIRTAQALLAPIPLLIHNTGAVFETDWASAAYETAKAEDCLQIVETPATVEAICSWLKKFIPQG